MGVMEGVYQGLFAEAAGLGTPEAAVLLSLFSRVVQLLWSLPGALVVLKAGRPDSTLFAEADSDLDKDM